MGSRECYELLRAPWAVTVGAGSDTEWRRRCGARFPCGSRSVHPVVTTLCSPGGAAQTAVQTYDPGEMRPGPSRGRTGDEGDNAVGILNEARREFIAAPDSAKSQ